MTKYEEYQLQWMIDHGYSIDDLIRNVQAIWKSLDEDKEEEEIIDVMNAYEVWYDSFGFGQSIWACEDEWEDYEAQEPSSKDQLKIRLLNGTLVATLSSDPNYPGIDVEYIDDHDLGESLSRPRILIEAPETEDAGQELRCLIWNDPLSEDYSEEINLINIDKTKEFLQCVAEIHDAIHKGALMLDPNNKNNILVWRSGDENLPDGCYAQNILDVASELLADKNNYASFRKVIAEYESKEGGNEHGL